MNAGFSVAGGKPLNTKLSKLALWMPRSVTTWATATERLTGCPIRLRLRIQLCTGRSSGGNEATLRHVLPANTGTCQHRKQCIGNCPSAEGLVKQGWSGGGPAIILEFVGLVHRNMRLLAKGSCKKASFKLSLLYYEELQGVEDTAVGRSTSVYVVSGLCGLLFAYACPLCTHVFGCEM